MQAAEYRDALGRDERPHAALIRDPVSNGPLVWDSEALGFAPTLLASPAAPR